MRSSGARPDLAFHAIAMGRFGDFQLVMRLEVHPEPGTRPEISSEPHGGIGGDAAATANDVVEPRARRLDRLAQRIHAEPERLQEFSLENFAGMNRRDVTLASCRHSRLPKSDSRRSEPCRRIPL